MCAPGRDISVKISSTAVGARYKPGQKSEGQRDTKKKGVEKDMAWRGAFNDCDSARFQDGTLCRLAAHKPTASFENKQVNADTQLMFATSVNKTAAPAANFSQDYFGEQPSVEVEQRHRLTKEITDIHRMITTTLEEQVDTQEELLRTLLSINEEIARTDNALRSSDGYEGDSSLARNLVSIHNMAADALDKSGTEMLQAERNRWIADLRRNMNVAGISSTVQHDILSLTEQRRQRGEQLEKLATSNPWGI